MTRTSKVAAVRRSILVRAPLDGVFRCMSDQQKLREWYYDDAEIDFRSGGFVTFAGLEGHVKATFREVQPPSLVVMEYSPPWWGVVTIRFEPVSDVSTRVHLLHTGFEGKEDWIDRFSWGWESILKSLKASAEGRPVR